MVTARSRHRTHKENGHGSKTDKIKGRIKEAGALTENDNLKREGQRDQAVGEVKAAVESAAEQVRHRGAGRGAGKGHPAGREKVKNA